MRLFLPSFICVLILILHSYIFRGKRITFVFFVSCYVMKALKCISDALPAQPDYMPTTDFLGLNVGGKPLGSYLFVIPIGWIFAHYISWCIAEAILKNNPNKRDAFFPTVVLSIFGTGLVGLCMEKVNEGILWWQWAPHAKTGATIYFLIWALWSIMFYYFFFILHIKGPKKRTLRIGAAVYIVLFMAFLAPFPFYPQLRWAYIAFILAQIPLFFINSVKLQPMRKEYIEAKEPV